MSVILSEVKGFTPVIDAVAEDVGVIEAVVYGVVWRYCQQKDGVCTASLATIAERVNLSHKTVQRHIKALCRAGYLEDTTPAVRNRPHVYRDTGLVKIQGLINVGRSESPTSAVGESESPSGSVTKSHLGRSESPLKILDTKEDTELQDKPDGRAWFLALATVCQVDLKMASTKQRGQVAQASKKLKDGGAQAEDIDAFGEWWYAEDWRGKQGQAPTVTQVRDNWGKFTAARAKAKSSRRFTV